jgi:hypothetical protein
MEASILTSTKKILGVGEEYEVFDLDILTHINSAFSVLQQLGIGPVEGFMIEDKTVTWDELELPVNQLTMVRTYIYLKTRSLFDPPTTSYLIEAVNKQIEEHEWRLRELREQSVFVSGNVPTSVIIDAGTIE